MAAPASAKPPWLRSLLHVHQAISAIMHLVIGLAALHPAGHGTVGFLGIRAHPVGVVGHTGDGVRLARGICISLV